ncbi:hypothetical protein N9Y92_03540 [Chlamydiales bacterium]|nr:hypothetical protein [Chlamydiales bacterium]
MVDQLGKKEIFDFYESQHGSGTAAKIYIRSRSLIAEPHDPESMKVEIHQIAVQYLTEIGQLTKPRIFVNQFDKVNKDYTSHKVEAETPEGLKAALDEFFKNEDAKLIPGRLQVKPSESTEKSKTEHHSTKAFLTRQQERRSEEEKIKANRTFYASLNKFNQKLLSNSLFWMKEFLHLRREKMRYTSL